MREPNDGWTSIPTIKELCDYHVYGQTDNILPLTMRYFSGHPSRHPSSELLGACRGKSKNTSDDKRNSAKKRVSSVIYHTVRDCFDTLTEFKMMSTPSLPVSNAFKNGPFKFTAALKRKDIVTKEEEPLKFGVPEVLTRRVCNELFCKSAGRKEQRGLQSFVSSHSHC